MKYIKGILRRLFNLFRLIFIKTIYCKSLFFHPIENISLSTRIYLSKRGFIKIGYSINTRRNVELRVDSEGKLTIGDECFFNNNCMVVCHEHITIGKDCWFGPNVMIFDHDHDFRATGGKKSGKYKTSPIIIGNNVWVGANTVILKGTTIGDNCVVGAGEVIKGNYSNNLIIVQKREIMVREYELK